MNLNLKPFFTSKKVIITTTLVPGQLIKTFTARDGIKYARIAFTNNVKFAGTWPVTDVPFRDIVGIRKLPSPFKKWLFGLIGKKPKATFYQFNKPLKKV